MITTIERAPHGRCPVYRFGFFCSIVLKRRSRDGYIGFTSLSRPFDSQTKREQRAIPRMVASNGECAPVDDKGVMTRARVKRLARLAAGSFLLLLVSGFAAPRSAWAGCGHPLDSQSDPYRDLHRVDAIFKVGSSLHSHDGMSRSPLESPARRSPCSGLSCSTRDPLPISTTSPGLESSQQWGASLGALIDLDANSPAGRTFDEPAPAATGKKASIFHPPRG